MSDLREAESRYFAEPETCPGDCEECSAPATTTVLDHWRGVIHLCDNCAPCEGCGEATPKECVCPDDERESDVKPF